MSQNREWRWYEMIVKMVPWVGRTWSRLAPAMDSEAISHRSASVDRNQRCCPRGGPAAVYNLILSNSHEITEVLWRNHSSKSQNLMMFSVWKLPVVQKWSMIHDVLCKSHLLYDVFAVSCKWLLTFSCFRVVSALPPLSTWGQQSTLGLKLVGTQQSIQNPCPANLAGCKSRRDM
jgi:hypothetical protein